MSRVRPMLQVVTPLATPAAESETLDPAMVFRRYAGYVAAVAHRLLGRDDEVDDTLQEVFLVAVRQLDQVRDPGALKGWLARVTVRVARRRLTFRRWRTRLGIEHAEGYESVADPSASPEERALIARVYRLLDQLPANERIAWTLRHVEGESLAEVAELCGCSLATAKRRILAAGRFLEEATDA